MKNELDYYLNAIAFFNECMTCFRRTVPRYEWDKRNQYIEILEMMIRLDMDVSDYTYDEFTACSNRNIYREKLYLYITNLAKAITYTGIPSLN